jgi:IS4 transposase
MSKCKTQRLEKQVYIGKKDKFPVRLIIEIMPEAEVAKRIKNANANNKKKGYVTSKEYLDRARFNLFITNIEKDVLETEAIGKIYKLRWQVELVFKAWKSIFGIDNNEEMKYERLICLLNARLLLILINWGMFMQKRSQLYEKTGKLLSINKCFKT